MPTSKKVVKPSTGSPSNAPHFDFQFSSHNPHHFQFIVNKKVWEHTLPLNTFTFYKDKIIAIDPCYKTQDGTFVPAKGKILYEYLKNNPESKNVLKFEENSPHTVQEGTVFYFKCLKGRIDKLEMCPSGTTLVGNICQPINSCTNKSDGTLLAHNFLSQYIYCLGGIEHVKKCPNDTFFYHDRCESKSILNHYCKHFNIPFLLDNETRVECQNGKPVYITCRAGTKFFKRDYCEPANCVGLPDGTKLPLPERKANPFKYVPGYMVCKNEKIHETVECPSNWDETLSKGDNLLSLPMVFDTRKLACSIPAFCENVFSNDPDIIVPVHDFTKKVKNWKFSKLFDHSIGIVCENNVRKRRHIPPEMRISKRFKAEPACGPTMPELLPIITNPRQYYDCNLKSTVSCPNSTFFNGSRCVSEPTNAFRHRGLPLFQFEPLNLESWIKPWDYSKDAPISCQNPESHYIELYNICSHPDCSNYAFLSQIPEMEILLPKEHQAKCKFDENAKALKKEPVNFKYSFWNQKIITSENENEKSCVVGEKLETGNFIWDSTIFATCNENQPFVFCPSTHTQKIIRVPGGTFACEPPNINSYIFNRVNEWIPFETNEIKRILPVNWNQNPDQFIRKNKGSQLEILPKDGIEIAEGERINLFVNQPVKIVPRYRVTHPPNVIFKYDDHGNKKIHTSTLDRGYLIKLKNFTEKSITIPRYFPIPFVEFFDPSLHV